MEAATARTLAGIGLPPPQLGERAAQLFNDGHAWRETSYAELGKAVRSAARGLIALGIAPGDRVAIVSHTRPEWTVANLAILAIGATSVSVYQTSSPPECTYVLEHSQARAVFCEDAEQVSKLERDWLPALEHAIAFEPADGALSMSELEARADDVEPGAVDARAAAVGPDDGAIAIYTSGTTGPPKGVVLTHANYRSMLDSLSAVAEFEDDEIAYLFLPLAHAYALLLQLLFLELGASLAYWRKDPQRIVEDLQQVRPTYFPAVPRIFEKLYAAATAQLDPQWRAGATRIGIAARGRLEAGESLPEDTRSDFEELDRVLFASVRELFGGRIRSCASGAAPIAPEILEFFAACGVPVFEGYGLTETSTSVTTNLPGAHKLGSVGRPLPGVEVRTAEDGEILVRGGNVFGGYERDPVASAQALRGGWLHTGDLGRLDDDGYLFITGRKKDIIVTAGGKNVAPANLENAIKRHPWVSQAVVVGDRRPYLAALVTLDAEAVPPDTAAAEARAAVEATIAEVNATVGPVERVKRFALLDADLSIEAGELTPTMKVKRNVVVERHAATIDALYDGSTK